MKWLSRASGGAVTALVATAGILVVTVIWLVLSAAAAEGQGVGYYGALIVEVDELPMGPTSIGIGMVIDSPLVATVVISAVLLIVAMVVRDQQRDRRKRLLAEAE